MCTEALEIMFHQTMAERTVAEEVQNITILFGNFSEHSKLLKNTSMIFNHVKTAIR